MKYFDCENTGTNIAAVGTTWGTSTRQDPTSTIDLGAAAVATPLCLFAPTVGSALNQRVGRCCYVKKIKVRGYMTIPNQAAQSAADAPTTVRVMLLQDKQTNSAQFTPAEVINGGSSATTAINGFANPNTFGRFRILKEKRFTIGNLNLANDTGATGGLVQAGLVVNFKFSHTFKVPVKVNFNATNGGTVADIIDDSFHLMAGVASAAYAPTISYYSRVAYKE